MFHSVKIISFAERWDNFRICIVQVAVDLVDGKFHILPYKNIKKYNCLAYCYIAENAEASFCFLKQFANVS